VGGTSEHNANEAEAWLARFAPLVMREPSSSAELAERITLARDLDAASTQVLASLAAAEDYQSLRVRQTIEAARDQLPGIIDDLRRNLAEADPGHAEAAVDLEALQSRLAERAAFKELGLRPSMRRPLRTDPIEILLTDRSDQRPAWRDGAFPFFILFGFVWVPFALPLVAWITLAFLILAFFAVYVTVYQFRGSRRAERLTLCATDSPSSG
jgi:hypothetical protein